MAKHKIQQGQFSVFITSFYPLCCTAQGLQAINKYTLPLFIDGSCRREPDFENNYPAITGLCRPGFVDRLDVGDLVIYTTNKRLLGSKRLIAILKVLEIKDDHLQAAEWYRGKVLPNNIIVNDNFPLPLDKTHGIGPWSDFGWTKGEEEEDADESVELWDETYKQRSNESKKVAICEVVNGIMDLNTPYEMDNQVLQTIFGRYPGMQTPPSITQDEWDLFVTWLNNNTRFSI